MRNLILKRFIQTTASSLESPEFFYGLNGGLAGKGVIVKDNAFQNLKSSKLQKKGATIAESLSGIPVHVRGTLGRASAISKAQYSKLLKQVTTHLSSISNIFVHDGAISSSPKSDAKVRVISDSPSAVLTLSNVLWETSTRAVSHDSCPLTVYAATPISSGSIPSISKLSPGQAAYRFLAGYQNGEFVPAYAWGPSCINALDLAKTLHSKLKENQIPTFLVNVGEEGKSVAGKDILKMVGFGNVAPLELKRGGDLKEKYYGFLSGKFQEIPEEFS